MFVEGIRSSARAAGISPLILFLPITPVATELPEKLNSLLWIARKKDTLALANIMGAMVFQSTFPVAIGLVGTPWQLDRFGLTSAGLAISSGLVLYILMRFRGKWRPGDLIICFLFYVGYILYLYF